jgi:FAD:protein FMN transferase
MTSRSTSRVPRPESVVQRSGFFVPQLIRLVLSLAVAVGFSVPAFGQRAPAPPPIVLSDEAMGTTFSIELHGADRVHMESAGRAALAEAKRIDRVLSNYMPDSEWSAMNRSAGRGPFAVSEELFDLLSACLSYSRATDGAFDVSVGPLMNVWGFFKAEGTMPTTDAVAGALASVGARHVRLDRARLTVEFLRPDVELDPGGIGKGYAIDRMVGVLATRGVISALVSAGGSSIFGLGAPPDSPDGWRVAVRHPRLLSGVAATVCLKNRSLSTSGSYEKFFRAGGRTYSHIMDPRTGFPARGTSSVSVVAPRTIDSEAWTKAYFVNGPTWAARQRDTTRRVFMCDDRWID